MKNHKVKRLTLLGAGPGDPELFTLKGVRALEEADVVLYDALVNVELLKYAKNAKEKIFVGKRFGCHALSQKEINELIQEKGTQYKDVVRLKGGDPFVFGRAQEEIIAATEAGMEVRVIPGISSALAVPASQMISLTSRGVSDSFWVVTGTTCSGEVSSDIHLAAQSKSTIVILMAMNKLEQIMELFSEYGKGDTPVAIIQNGTTDTAKIVRGRVRDIYYRSLYAEIGNPAVIVVGEVVELNENIVRQLKSERFLTAENLFLEDNTINIDRERTGGLSR